MIEAFFTEKKEEYFYCTPLKARIRKEICFCRQHKKIDLKEYRREQKGVWWCGDRDLFCISGKCEQGQAILIERDHKATNVESAVSCDIEYNSI